MQSQPGEALVILVNPGNTTGEANSGDNLLLFDGENKLHKDKIYTDHAGKSIVTPSALAKGTGENAKAKESENFVIFRPYARRNHTKSNYDGARVGSGDVSHGLTSKCLPGSRDPKGSVSDANRNDQNLTSASQLKSSNINNEIVQKNDDSHNVESVVMSTAETVTNVPGRRKELVSDAKSNGDLLDCGTDHGKSQDGNSLHAGIAAAETTEIANGASRLSDAPTTIQRTGTPSQSDVLLIPKEIIDSHPDGTTLNLGIQTPKNVRDTCSNPICEDAIEPSRDPIIVSYEARKSINEDPSESNIDSKLVDTSSAAIFDDGRHCDTINSSVIKVEEVLNLRNKSVTSESLKTTGLHELQVKKNADSMIDHKSGPTNDTAEARSCAIASLGEDSKTIPTGEAPTDKDVPDNTCSKKVTDKVDEDSILAEAKLILVS